MAFQFQCPRCGAQSRVEESSIGESGPCRQCGETVTVYPSSTQLQPPHIGMAALFGALVGGVVFLAAFLSLRTIPMLVSLNASMMLSSARVVRELLWTAGGGAIGAAAGAVLLGGGAALVETRRSYSVLRWGVLVGGLFGLLLGALVGSLHVSGGRGMPNAQFFIRGEAIAMAMICASAVCGAFGGLVAVPLAVNRERRLIRQASFTAPTIPRADPPADKDQPLVAQVVEPAPQPRGELTSERRQELIRRLGVVREPTAEEER